MRERYFGQRTGVHLAVDNRLAGGLEGQAGAHPTGQADAERARRELPRQGSRRVPQHKLAILAQRPEKVKFAASNGILANAGFWEASARHVKTGEYSGFPFSQIGLKCL